jgi:hypothetical protein
MPNFVINTRDIPGLQDQLINLSTLLNIVTIGPLKVNNIAAYKTLEAGYDIAELDYSYNLNIKEDAKIGNNLDIYNDLNVMNNCYNNKLIVYNLKNYEYQLIFNGLMYIYIDKNYNVYPAYLHNNIVHYLDPKSLSINDVVTKY